MYGYHPFVESFIKNNNGTFVLPPQLMLFKDKMKNKDKFGVSSWQKTCMNVLESIAISQYNDNRRLIENARLLNGEFIPHDYLNDCEDCDEILDPLEKLIQEGRLPKYIKHYDIISTPIRKIQNEINNLPDSFHVVSKGEVVEAEEMERQNKILQNLVWEQFDKYINEQLEQEGVDLEQEFPDEESKAAFEEEIKKYKDSKKKPERIEFENKSHRNIIEYWAEEELNDQKERFELKKKRRREFGDLLTYARRFRHLKITPNSFKIETWNPITTFYHKTSEVEYVQDGDYVGRFSLMTISDIIDNFGMYLTEEQIKTLENNWWNDKDTKTALGNKDVNGNAINYLNPYGLPYGHWLVSMNPYVNYLANQPFGLPTSNVFGFSDLYNSNLGLTYGQMFIVTEAYWKSKKRMGLLKWINPSTNELETILVDEDFVKPKWVKEVFDASMVDIDNQEINTIIYTWINEIWQGIKINNSKILDGTGALYINVKPCDFQFKSDLYLHEAKLPVGGQIINNRNTKPMSLVDICKPEQFSYNLARNTAIKLFERSILPFLVMDLGILPKTKDWTSDQALWKWLMGGEKAGVAPVDTSPSNTQGAAQTGGQYPRWIDNDLTPRITAYFNMAAQIQQMLYQKIGMTPERLGDIKGVDTATGINTSVAKSFEATSHWFIEFFECEKHLLKMQLDVAQWLQSKSKDKSAMFVKSDFSKKFLQLNNNTLSLYDLHIYISDAQEELKKIQAYQMLASQNTNTNLPTSARMSMMTDNNAERIKDLVEQAEKQIREQEAQIQAFKDRELQAKTELEKQRLEQEKQMFYDKLANDLKEAYIKSRGYLGEGEQDLDNSGIPDAFEYEKFAHNAQMDYQKTLDAQEKLNMERDKEYQRRLEKQQELELQRQKLDLERDKVRQTAINVTKLSDKSK